MTRELTSKIKRLESILDLNSLKQGDIIQLKYLSHPYNLNNILEVKGMYYINPLHPNSERLSFIVPLFNSRKSSILVYKIKPKLAQVEEGKLVMHERVSKISQYDKSTRHYKFFLEILNEQNYFICN